MRTELITKINIGTIFMYHDFKLVLFDVHNKENAASTSYDRTYKAIPFEKLEDIQSSEEYWETTYEELEKMASHKITLKGTTKPFTVDVYDEEAPFDFSPIRKIRVRRKQKVVSVAWE